MRSNSELRVVGRNSESFYPRSFRGSTLHHEGTLHLEGVIKEEDFTLAVSDCDKAIGLPILLGGVVTDVNGGNVISELLRDGDPFLSVLLGAPESDSAIRTARGEPR